MIIDRTHVRWGLGTAVASLITAWLYLANNHPQELEKWHLALSLPAWFGPIPPLRGNFGATPLGLVFGTVALLIFLFAALLGWRRNHSSWPVGRIQVWLKAHIWLTILTIPLVLFHCGFEGGGPMTEFLLGLYAFVMLSGFWGLALQHIVPKLMREYLPQETIFEQIPFIRTQLVSQAENLRQELAVLPDDPPLLANAGGGTATMASSQKVALRAAINFIDQQALPYLKSSAPGQSLLRNKQPADDQFRLLKSQIPPTHQTHLIELQSLCDEKRRLDFQCRLHFWLHGWLLVHAPASILLFVLTIVHAIVATFIYA